MIQIDITKLVKERGGNLTNNTSEDIQKIDKQIILYKVRLHELIQKFL